MPLVIRQEKWGSRPVFVCDICGRDIENGWGIYAWWCPNHTGAQAVPKFVHGGDCFKKLEEQEENFQHFMHLSDLLVFMKNNLNVNIEKREKLIRDLGL